LGFFVLPLTSPAKAGPALRPARAAALTATASNAFLRICDSPSLNRVGRLGFRLPNLEWWRHAVNRRSYGASGVGYRRERGLDGFERADLGVRIRWRPSSRRPTSERRHTSTFLRLRSNPACNIEGGSPLSSLLGDSRRVSPERPVFMAVQSSSRHCKPSSWCFHAEPEVTGTANVATLTPSVR
jgi:hypothetical protein